MGYGDEEHNKVCGPLLRELVRRWDERSEGFRIRGRVVSFTTLYVCFAIGLPIVGEHVSLDNSVEGCVKQLFNSNQDITVQNIVAKCKELSGEDEVEDFCRVYILLAFLVLYFPRTTPFVFRAPFRLLDDLDAQWEYNWGLAVYEFLVNSLSRATRHYNTAKNSTQISIAGCAAVLQIWAVEHLSLRPISTATCFPRINMWTEIQGGSKQLEEALKHNRVLEVLDATEEDRQNPVLLEAINEAEGGFRHSKNPKPEMEDPKPEIEDLVVQHQMLLAQNKEFETRISFVEGEMSSLKKIVLGHHVSMGTNQSVGHASEDVVPVTTRMESVSLTTSVVNEGHMVPNSNLLKKLYNFCTRESTKYPKQILVKMFGLYITVEDLQSMRSRGWLSNMVMYLAAKALMEDEKEQCGVITRFHFTNAFADNVIGELASFRMGQEKTWSKRTISGFVGDRYNPLDQIMACNLIFAPALYERHWSYYVLDQNQNKMYVLDSLYDERSEGQMRLDRAMRQHLQDLLGLLYPKADKNGLQLNMTYEVLPKQHNFDDCGIYVLKYMEMWDGVKKWGDHTMLYWTPDDVDAIRQELVCRWVLHPKNENREIALELAGLPKNLTMNFSWFSD